jgi:hypothetical protein
MALIITDPTSLISGGDTGTAFLAPISIDPATKTITITPGSGILPAAADGVTLQCLYSALKLLWKNNTTYVKYPFPIEMITPEQGELLAGWAFANATTRKAIRTAGWVERNASGNIIKMFAGVISLGSLGASDQPYFQQSNGGAATNFAFTGPVNEAIQVLDDPDGNGNYTDGYDYRAYCKVFAREYQKTYASATLTDIGVSSMTYIVYRFPLANGSDLKITHDDTAVQASPYTSVTITYYGVDQNRSIGGTNYPFRVIINGANLTAEQIYEKVQYQLRQNTDIDAGAGTVTGKTADSLLRFVGDTLVTSTGVYIDNFNSNDTNRIEFYDQNAVKRTFPFVAAGNLVFNSNLVNDPSAKYWMFFTTLPGANNDFGESGAVLVQNSSSADITGSVSAGTIPWSFAYDSNTQGGRTAGTDAAVTVVAIGANTAQYVSTTATITRSTGQNISLTASLERNYNNA